MDIKKWVPWNWFKKEEAAEGHRVPVRREAAPAGQTGPADSLVRFHREIDRLFEQAFRGFGAGLPSLDRSAWPFADGGLLKPTLDLGATANEYTVNVEIPGVDEKDIDLEIVNDTLTIRGEKRQESEHRDRDYYRMERSYGSFQRVLSLPEDVDQGGVRAAFDKGVLTIILPRRSVPRADVRKITVTGA